MTTTAINGHDHATGRKITQSDDVHAHAPAGDRPGNGAKTPEAGQEPTYTRAIPRKILDRQAHAVRNFLRPHLGEVGEQLTRGWALDNELPTPAEVLRKLLPVRSRWYAWPLDLAANLFWFALIFVAYLAVNAASTRRRRRIGFLLTVLAFTIPVLVRLLAG